MKIAVLGSGSKGNSTYIDLGNKKILIDVGFSYKQIKEKLKTINVDPKEIDAVLITHDHSDHTYGLKVFLKEVKPDFIKTSTGFGTSGATPEDVRLMKETVGADVKVKAAGGIRDWETCKAMIDAGAERIGTSNSIKICNEFEEAK